MKALFVSQYADPNLVSGNNNVFRQARALTHELDLRTEILTWPEGDAWSGPRPSQSAAGWSRLEWVFDAVKYHIVGLPGCFVERVMSEARWRQAVRMGREMLLAIRPDVVHLQHWRGMWWMLEAARSLGLPTVYSSHDWGMGCLRTVLVKGEGGLCDGVVESSKCARCIWRGRGLIGKANEMLAGMPGGESVLSMAGRLFGEKRMLQHEVVRLGLRRRLDLNTRRARESIANLGALLVPSSFAKQFFLQFGVAPEKIHIEPWYSDLSPASSPDARERVVCGYIGRISPDKGVRRIFEALLAATDAAPVHLVIAGAIRGAYAEDLQKEFREHAGQHSVEWMGFIPNADVHRFYDKVDVVLISSEWMDNTPLSLVESMACKRPVIISDLPTVRDIVQDGRNGFLVKMGSTAALSDAITRVSRLPGSLERMRAAILPVKSTRDYAGVIKSIYSSLPARGTAL